MKPRFSPFFLAPLLAGALTVTAVTPTAGPYDPKADAAADLKAAGARAGASGKRVLAVVGGNWCGWCRALDRLMHEDPKLKAVLDGGFELVHVNYSKENKNEAVMTSLERPDELGFPALVVLSPTLEVLTKQETERFENPDKKHPGHDPARVAEFLRAWLPKKD